MADFRPEAQRYIDELCLLIAKRQYVSTNGVATLSDEDEVAAMGALDGFWLDLTDEEEELVGQKIDEMSKTDLTHLVAESERPGLLERARAQWEKNKNNPNYRGE